MARDYFLTSVVAKKRTNRNRWSNAEEWMERAKKETHKTTMTKEIMCNSVVKSFLVKIKDEKANTNYNKCLSNKNFHVRIDKVSREQRGKKRRKWKKNNGFSHLIYRFVLFLNASLIERFHQTYQMLRNTRSLHRTAYTLHKSYKHKLFCAHR